MCTLPCSVLAYKPTYFATVVIYDRKVFKTLVKDVNDGGNKGFVVRRVTRRYEKSPNFSKSSQNSLQFKFSTTYLYLKVQNIYKKPLLKP
jgi:hypothetical protein